MARCCIFYKHIIHVVNGNYCNMDGINNFLLFREHSALSDLQYQFAWMSVCMCVQNSEVKYLGN